MVFAVGAHPSVSTANGCGGQKALENFPKKNINQQCLYFIDFQR
jgi:hypothetical protein